MEVLDSADGVQHVLGNFCVVTPEQHLILPTFSCCCGWVASAGGLVVDGGGASWSEPSSSPSNGSNLSINCLN